jgi:hypothetical protein
MQSSLLIDLRRYKNSETDAWPVSSHSLIRQWKGLSEAFTLMFSAMPGVKPISSDKSSQFLDTVNFGLSFMANLCRVRRDKSLSSLEDILYSLRISPPQIAMLIKMYFYELYSPRTKIFSNVPADRKQF